MCSVLFQLNLGFLVSLRRMVGVTYNKTVLLDLKY